MMDEKTVRHVATLARLELSEAELARFAQELGKVTDHMAELSKVDVHGIDPTLHPIELLNAWREDQPRPSLPRDVALRHAPDKEEGFFRVPPVIE